MSKKVETNAKRNNALTVKVEGRLLTIDFASGKSLSVSAETLSSEILDHAIMHGLKQKLVDAAALSRDPKTGASATIAEKETAVRDMAQRLSEGTWNTRGTGDGGSMDGLLVTALCEMQPKKEPAKIREWVGGLDKSQQSAMRANPKVAAIIARIQTERATAKGIDTDAMLEGLSDA